MTRFVGYDGHEAQQEDDELHELLELAKKHNVTRYLEIGMAHGIGFHAMVTNLPPDGLYIGVDLPVDHASGPLVAGLVARDLTRRGYSPMMIWGNSKSPQVVEMVSKFAPFDMVFIDGDHTPSGVLADWDNYGPMGKMVCFHDIYSDFVPVFGVGKLWNVIKQNYRHQQITGVAGTKVGMGVGVLWRE